MHVDDLDNFLGAIRLLVRLILVLVRIVSTVLILAFDFFLGSDQQVLRCLVVLVSNHHLKMLVSPVFFGPLEQGLTLVSSSLAC